MQKFLDMRWRIALMLCVITTINYLDRQALSVAAPVLMEEFSISNTQYGWIGSAFLFAYALGQLLTGPLIDRLGTKRGFKLAVVMWSVAGLLHIFSRGFWSLFSLRGLLGLGEAANFPAALKAIAEWFSRAERSMAVGVLTVGPGLGSVLAPPFLGSLIYYLGWQWAFIVPGVLGFIWVWWWRRMYHLPEVHPRLSPKELALILEGREEAAAESVTRRLTDFLRYREVWGLMLSRFVSDGAFYFFVLWLPAYLASERGFNIIEIGLFAWIPFLAADLGSLAGGWAG
jgi:ACS family hexuronate transporter-like MFS transporter